MTSRQTYMSVIVYVVQVWWL